MRQCLSLNVDLLKKQESFPDAKGTLTVEYNFKYLFIIQGHYLFNVWQQITEWLINVNAKMVEKRVQFWCSLLNAHYIPSVFIPPSYFSCLIALILYGMSDVLGRIYFPTYGSSCVVWIYEWTIHPMGTETAISISEVCKMKDSEP